MDLTGLVVRDLDGSELFTVSDVLIDAGGSITFGNNSDPAVNGGLQHEFIYSAFNLSNSGDEIVLEMNGTVIDEVDYGATGFPDPNGASMSLAPEHYDQSRMTMEPIGVHPARSLQAVTTPLQIPSMQAVKHPSQMRMATATIQPLSVERTVMT